MSFRRLPALLASTRRVGLCGWALLLACGAGAPPDPRSDILSRLDPGGSTSRSARDALAAGRMPEACRAARFAVHQRGDPGSWIDLLTVTARSPGCMPDRDGASLVEWGKSRPDAEGWSGAIAEWKAAHGDLPGAISLLRADDPGAALRVMLAAGDGERALDAAAAVRLLGPDVLACRILALDALARQDLVAADEDATCGPLGAQSAELQRLSAEVLDRAGQTERAAAAYEALGMRIHLAALRYQTGAPEPARALLAAESSAPSALHRVWLARCTGSTPTPADVAALDDSPEAQLARALVRPEAADLEALKGMPGSVAAATLAQVLWARGDRDGALSTLNQALPADPAAMPLHRLKLALLGDAPEQQLRDSSLSPALTEALEAIRQLDPDHVRLRGERGPRDAPWCAIVPDAGAAVQGLLPTPSGRSPVGDALRDALQMQSLPLKMDALTTLATAGPELEGLAALRWNVARGEQSP